MSRERKKTRRKRRNEIKRDAKMEINKRSHLLAQTGPSSIEQWKLAFYNMAEHTEKNQPHTTHTHTPSHRHMHNKANFSIYKTKIQWDAINIITWSRFILSICLLLLCRVMHSPYSHRLIWCFLRLITFNIVCFADETAEMLESSANLALLTLHVAVILYYFAHF